MDSLTYCLMRKVSGASLTRNDDDSQKKELQYRYVYYSNEFRDCIFFLNNKQFDEYCQYSFIHTEGFTQDEAWKQNQARWLNTSQKNFFIFFLLILIIHPFLFLIFLCFLCLCIVVRIVL